MYLIGSDRSPDTPNSPESTRQLNLTYWRNYNHFSNVRRNTSSSVRRVPNTRIDRGARYWAKRAYSYAFCWARMVVMRTTPFSRKIYRNHVLRTRISVIVMLQSARHVSAPVQLKYLNLTYPRSNADTGIGISGKFLK